MSKKKVLILICIAIAACTSIIAIIFSYHALKANKNEIVISPVALKTVNDLLIGSEPPNLIYAYKEKVIFDCRGIRILY